MQPYRCSHILLPAAVKRPLRSSMLSWGSPQCGKDGVQRRSRHIQRWADAREHAQCQLNSLLECLHARQLQPSHCVFQTPGAGRCWAALPHRCLKCDLMWKEWQPACGGARVQA